MALPEPQGRPGATCSAQDSGEVRLPPSVCLSVHLSAARARDPGCHTGRQVDTRQSPDPELRAPILSHAGGSILFKRTLWALAAWGTIFWNSCWRMWGPEHRRGGHEASVTLEQLPGAPATSQGQGGEGRHSPRGRLASRGG